MEAVAFFQNANTLPSKLKQQSVGWPCAHFLLGHDHAVAGSLVSDWRDRTCGLGLLVCGASKVSRYPICLALTKQSLSFVQSVKTDWIHLSRSSRQSLKRHLARCLCICEVIRLIYSSKDLGQLVAEVCTYWSSLPKTTPLVCDSHALLYAAFVVGEPKFVLIQRAWVDQRMQWLALHVKYKHCSLCSHTLLPYWTYSSSTRKLLLNHRPRKDLIRISPPLISYSSVQIYRQVWRQLSYSAQLRENLAGFGNSGC